MNTEKLRGRHHESGENIVVTIENGVIACLETDDAPPENNAWIAPGFVDLQVNGYGGYDFNCDSWTGGQTGPDAPHKIAHLLLRSGTTTACPTIVTSTREGILQSFRALSQALQSDANLTQIFPCFHLEGPYISSEEGARGAHPPHCARDADWDEFQSFQEAADGRIQIITLAPERDDALPFIERAVASGVVVAIGHTAATPPQIRDAVRAGATLSTHLGNGSHAVLPRHENYLWQQLAQDEMTACVIADGHHLPPELVKIMARVKGENRLCLVSDAVALGGLAPGLYSDGRHEVLPTGKVVLAGTPFLAGAGTLLDECILNALRWTELGMSGVTRAASENPARVLAMSDRGALEVGKRADLVTFRVPPEDGKKLEIVAVIQGGNFVNRGAQ